VEKKEDLIVFKNESFGELRSFSINGEIWFVAKDVCDMLGHSNSRKAVQRHVDEDDVTFSYITDSLGRKVRFSCINESGLYALILQSRKKEAKQFKRWVTSEVLPSIRKTGKYDLANKSTEDEYITDTIRILPVEMPVVYFPEKRFLYIALKPLNDFLEGSWRVVEDFVKDNRLSYDYFVFDSGHKEFAVLHQDYIRLVKAINHKNIPSCKRKEVNRLKRDVPKVLQGYILGADNVAKRFDSSFCNMLK